MKAAAALLLIAALSSGATLAQTSSTPAPAEAPARVQTAYATPAGATEGRDAAQASRDAAASELADVSVVPMLLLVLAAIGIGVYRRTQFQD